MVTKVIGTEEEKTEVKLLHKAQKKFEYALSEHNKFVADCGIYDDLYNGTKTMVDGGDNAKQVVNIVYKNIEASIDPYVPQPRVDMFEENDIERKKMVEGQLTQLSQSTELLSQNGENERIVKKNSLAVFKVGYDADYDYHTAKGKVTISTIHPVNFIPQPRVHRIKDMDYCFHVESRSVDYVCRKYGEEFRSELEGTGEHYSELEEFSESTSGVSKQGSTVSLVEYWFKDKEGDIGVLTYVDDTVIAYKPKYYYKDTLKKVVTEDEDGELESFKEEMLAEFINPETNQQESEMIQVRPHIIKKFPFVVWYNTQKEKSFRGISDVEIIKDQQEGLKKLISIEMDKCIKGTTITFCKDKTLASKITNATGQVIHTDDPHNIVTKDLTSSDRSSRELISMLDNYAQQVSGVTNASQGLVSSEMSGEAIKQLTINAQTRLSPKKTQKNIAYTELYSLCYDFMLAFYDDVIPFRYDADNVPTYGYFDKSKLVKVDEAGEFYYASFDITVQVDDGIGKDRKTLYDLIMAVGNRMEPTDFWTAMERIGFPGATENKKRAMERENLAQQKEQLESQKNQMNAMVAQMQAEIPAQGGNPNEVMQ